MQAIRQKAEAKEGKWLRPKAAGSPDIGNFRAVTYRHSDSTQFSQLVFE